MSDFMMAYVTCSSKDKAEKILRALLEERLVACGNISLPVTSYFHWKGVIESSEEVMLILKTKASLFKAAEEKIAALHSYEVPCILGFEINQVHEPYKRWMEEEVS